MRKLVFCLTLICILLVILVSANSYQKKGNDWYGGNAGLTKGWNLVNMYVVDDIFDNNLGGNYQSYIDNIGIKAVYFYDNYNKDYIMLYPDKEQDKIDQLLVGVGDPESGGDLEKYIALTNGAMWVYNDKDIGIDFNTVDGPIDYTSFDLKAGWNFVSVHPDMTDKEKTIMDLKGSCNIQKAYVYAGDDYGGWRDISSDVLDSGYVWFGMILKVSSDCRLGSGGGSSVPPSLPSGEGNIDYPEEIAGYPLIGVYDDISRRFQDCSDPEDGEQICLNGLGSATYGNSVESDDIIFYEVNPGSSAYKVRLKSLCNETLYECNNDYSGDIIIDSKSYDKQKIIYWFYGNDKLLRVKQWGDGMQVIDSPVVQYFLNNYPPINI